MTRVARRLIVEGRVQGVGYRWWTVGEATRLGLAGWVRNRADGSVEVLAMGEGAVLDRFAERCGAGPAGAAVARVSVTGAVDDGSIGFEQRPTS